MAVGNGEDLKCGGCNWRVNRLYLMAESKEEADELYKEIGGLCGDCMAELLAEKEYEIHRELSDEEMVV